MGLTTLYAKAAVVSARRMLPVVGGTPSLSERTVSASGVEIDREHVAEYAEVCGFRLRDELPPTYPHMVSFPLAMELIVPMGALGLVHVENRIEQRRPLLSAEPLDVSVWAEGLEETDRGREFDVVGEASVGGEVAWREVSRYLKRGGDSGASSGGRSKQPASAPRGGSVWEVPGDIGRRYGAVSGDRNPIHLHPLTARAFGMPKPIAHGMWVKARALAALEGELPDAFAVDVRFKTPLAIPARVVFFSRRKSEDRTFSVKDAKSGKPHLEGTVTPL